MDDDEAEFPVDLIPPPLRAPVDAEPPLLAYQAALRRYDAARLLEIYQALGLPDPPPKPSALPGAIGDHLGESRVVDRALAGLETPDRLALSLFALTESATWPMTGLAHALACLGADPVATVRRLAGRGLVAIAATEGEPIDDLARWVGGDPGRLRVLAHPWALSGARTVLPEGPRPLVTATATRLRETDGLETVVRLAAVWQRVDEAPLRQTQQGTLYKRDRERVEDDPVLAGPIADALEPLPDMAALWLALATGVGLLAAEPGSDRVVAARPEFWAENAYHLPQMIATRWLGLRTWHEQGGMQQEGSTAELALPYIRPAVLLWLATLPEDGWVALDDLAAHLAGLAPGWDRAAFVAAAGPAIPARPRPNRGKAEGRAAPKRSEAGPLESLLLGAAYQLGLVRAAEEAPGGRRVVQLAPLGRYILALGPPPPARPAFEHFLFVQPNFEIIAYRQGLTPALIGQFSRFTRWSQVGAALELRMTPESVYHGLEGGLTPEAMLDRLARHSARPLPAGVAEAVRTWAGRRDRVTYHASATLIEFASLADLQLALEHWPATGRPAPVAISERFLLVEDESAIPFHRFRLSGSRDYRRPPEACLDVEADGVTLALDLGRSDLLVDAELSRFADALPLEPSSASPGNPKRRFRVTKASLARAAENGLSQALLSHWYARRTGAEIPAAVRLLLLAASSRVPVLATSRPLVLHTPTADLLDGLLQHPDTCGHLGDRLGPTTVIIPEDALAGLRRALQVFDLTVGDPSPSPASGTGLVPNPAAREPSRRN